LIRPLARQMPANEKINQISLMSLWRCPEFRVAQNGARQDFDQHPGHVKT
jgi:hypothetical protein